MRINCRFTRLRSLLLVPLLAFMAMALVPSSASAAVTGMNIGGCLYTGASSVEYAPLGPEVAAIWNTDYSTTSPINEAQVMVQNQHDGGAVIAYGTMGLGGTNCWEAAIPDVIDNATGLAGTDGIPDATDLIVIYSAADHGVTSREFLWDGAAFTHHTGTDQGAGAFWDANLGRYIDQVIAGPQDAYLPPFTVASTPGGPLDQLPNGHRLHYVFYDHFTNGGDNGPLIDPGLNGATVRMYNEAGDLVCEQKTGELAFDFGGFTTVDGVSYLGPMAYGFVYCEVPGNQETIIEVDPSTVTQADNPHFQLFSSSINNSRLDKFGNVYQVDHTGEVCTTPDGHIEYDQTGCLWYQTYTEEGGHTGEGSTWAGDPGTEGGGYFTWHGFIEKIGSPLPNFSPINGSITGQLHDADAAGEEALGAINGGRVGPTGARYPDSLGGETWCTGAQVGCTDILNQDLTGNGIVEGSLVALYSVGTFPRLVATAEAITLGEPWNTKTAREYNFVNIPSGTYELFAFNKDIFYVPTVGTPVTVTPGAIIRPGILVPRFAARLGGFAMLDDDLDPITPAVPIVGAPVKRWNKSGTTKASLITDAEGWFLDNSAGETGSIGHVYLDIPDGAAYRGKIVTELFQAYFAPTGLPIHPAPGIYVTHNSMNRTIQWWTLNYFADLQMEMIPLTESNILGTVFNDVVDVATRQSNGVYDDDLDRMWQGETVELYDVTVTDLNADLIVDAADHALACSALATVFPAPVAAATAVTGTLNLADQEAMGWVVPFSMPVSIGGNAMETGTVHAGPVTMDGTPPAAPAIGLYEFRSVVPGDYCVRTIPASGFARSPGELVEPGGFKPVVAAPGLNSRVDLGVNTRPVLSVGTCDAIPVAAIPGACGLDSDVSLQGALCSVNAECDYQWPGSTTIDPTWNNFPGWEAFHDSVCDLGSCTPSTGLVDMIATTPDLDAASLLNNTAAYPLPVPDNPTCAVDADCTVTTWAYWNNGTCEGYVPPSTLYQCSNTGAACNTDVSCTVYSDTAVPLAGELEGGVWKGIGGVDTNPLSLIYMEQPALIGGNVIAYDNNGYFLGMLTQADPNCNIYNNAVHTPGDPLDAFSCLSTTATIQGAEAERRFLPGSTRFVANVPGFLGTTWDPTVPSYDPNWVTQEVPYTIGQGGFAVEKAWTPTPVMTGGLVNEFCAVGLTATSFQSEPWGANATVIVTDGFSFLGDMKVQGSWDTGAGFSCVTDGAGRCTDQLEKVEGGASFSVLTIDSIDNQNTPWYLYNPNITEGRLAGVCRTTVMALEPGATPPPLPQCSDFMDNDGDGAVDAADPGCKAGGVYNPLDDDETNPALPQCSDGNDNDGDTVIDDLDPGCWSGGAVNVGVYDPLDNNETDPAPLPACSNGADDDLDGLVDDWDPGCYNGQFYDPNDNDETDPIAQCNDGLDNDGNGFTDFAGGDPGCTSPTDQTEQSAVPPVACNDNLDNDGDGLIDFAGGLQGELPDPGCTSALDTTEANICSDGIDNDGDGLIDTADAGCINGQGMTEANICADGIDNDGDGLTDLADAGCAGDATGMTEANACDDGLDNDGDGAYDFPADLGCTSATDMTEANVCSDGIDNDGDGFTDFAGGDPGCSSGQDMSEENATGGAGTSYLPATPAGDAFFDDPEEQEKWTAAVTIFVESNGADIADGALVSVDYEWFKEDKRQTGTLSCVTSGGSCTVTLAGLKGESTPEVTFQVADVTSGILTYDAGNNVGNDTVTVGAP